MNTLKKSPSLASFTSLWLVLALCLGTLVCGSTQAQSGHGYARTERYNSLDEAHESASELSPLVKVSPDLCEQLDHQSSGHEFSTMDAKGGAIGGAAGGGNVSGGSGGVVGGGSGGAVGGGNVGGGSGGVV